MRLTTAAATATVVVITVRKESLVILGLPPLTSLSSSGGPIVIAGVGAVVGTLVGAAVVLAGATVLPGAAVVGAVVGVAVNLSDWPGAGVASLFPLLLLPLPELPLVALVPQPHTRKNSESSTKTNWPVASTSPTDVKRHRTRRGACCKNG